MRELVYYVAVSMDGYIAAPDGDFSAFPVNPATVGALFERYPETCPAQARELFGVTGRPRRFDTVVMGARTYAPAREAGMDTVYPSLREIVVTHQELPNDGPMDVLRGDVAGHIKHLKAEPGLDIWLCGGADLAGQLFDLIDEVQLKVNPVILGAGVPLFQSGLRVTPMRLVSSEQLPGGVVLTTYRRE
ncbi:dihydrofolate reductase [Kocuria sp. JC486]|uniref:dihydrofolate reductase family protein n=1 Tax=Kocuria sp. JC486 TaxID=1970736 RepID=UPI001422B4DE|nr:dihydrofolate reductase family protein [Kocuria sp. JC486]NHU85219.1 dihydrofolate reductase [Kocuria sp. JC486]